MACCVAILMSVHKASSQPPPSAGPSTIEIVGQDAHKRFREFCGPHDPVDN